MEFLGRKIVQICQITRICSILTLVHNIKPPMSKSFSMPSAMCTYDFFRNLIRVTYHEFHTSNWYRPEFNSFLRYFDKDNLLSFSEYFWKNVNLRAMTSEMTSENALIVVGSLWFIYCQPGIKVNLCQTSVSQHNGRLIKCPPSIW